MQQPQAHGGTPAGILTVGAQIASVGTLFFAAAFGLGFVRRFVILGELSVPQELVQYDPLATALDFVPILVLLLPFAVPLVLYGVTLTDSRQKAAVQAIWIVVGVLGFAALISDALTNVNLTPLGLLLWATALFVFTAAPTAGAASVVGRRPFLVRGAAAVLFGAGVALVAGMLSATFVEQGVTRITVVTTDRVEGLTGYRGEGCGWVYPNIVLAYVSPGEILIQEHGTDGTWIVPRDDIVSIRAPAASLSPVPSSVTCLSDAR